MGSFVVVFEFSCDFFCLCVVNAHKLRVGRVGSDVGVAGLVRCEHNGRV